MKARLFGLAVAILGCFILNSCDEENEGKDALRGLYLSIQYVDAEGNSLLSRVPGLVDSELMYSSGYEGEIRMKIYNVNDPDKGYWQSISYIKWGEEKDFIHISWTGIFEPYMNPKEYVYRDEEYEFVIELNIPSILGEGKVDRFNVSWVVESINNVYLNKLQRNNEDIDAFYIESSEYWNLDEPFVIVRVEEEE